MGALEALARLAVPPVPPGESAGGTPQPLAIQHGSPGSPGSPANTRGGDNEPKTFPCTTCGRFAFPRPLVCYWCRRTEPAP